MGADVSRVRFDPRRNYTGVVHQQGRVVLDADHNEQVAITDRRHRAAAADLGSPGAVPGIRGTAVVPRTTPDAFRPTLTGGVLAIGRGRMYVDGLLAENHGTGPAGFDPLLAGPVGGADTPYLSQPWWPTAPPLPTTGTHLVYLDVWERERTSVEQPDLVDPALAVDTTARTQVVWQVRVHPADTPGLTCATPDAAITDWEKRIAPSAGRLTVDTVDVPADSNPCSLPPSGNFRGLENQTYRVEIHAGGAPGTATFKWSRDNASVTLPVTEVVSGNRLRLASLGRDEDVLGLADGQWVEVLDDHRELDQQAGEMRKITVHREDLSVSFTPALPAGWPTTTAAALERRLRVRRWDQAGLVKSAAGGNVTNLDAPGSTGVITVPASGAAVVLEHGVTVALTAPGGVFRSGDHWIFAARTGDTSVEKLQQAAPRGVHHHYARLGVLGGGAIAEPDCRTLWPPEQVEAGCGDCTVCVSAEDHNSGDLTIQDAIDKVAEDGGTVCLGVGTFRLGEPVRLEGVRGVHVRGQGGATLVLAESDGFVVTRSAFVTLSDLVLISAGGEAPGPEETTTPAAGVRLVACWEVTVERLTILVTGGDGGRESGIKLQLLAVLARIRDNFVAAPVGVGGWADPDPPLMLFGVTIAGNTLAASTTGVALDTQVAHVGDTEVVDNLVLGATVAGISLTGVKAPAALVSVDGNELGVSGNGVVIGTSGVVVTDNTVTGTWSDERIGADQHGVVVEGAAVPVEIGTTTRVVGNRISGFGGHGVLLEGLVTGAEVAHNEVYDTGDGIAVTCRATGQPVHVTDNLVHDVGLRVAEGEDVTSSIGIRVGGAERCLVGDNTVQTVGEASEARQFAAGVVLLGVLEARCTGNSVTDVGSVATPGSAVDYGVLAVRQLTMEANCGWRRAEFERLDDFRADGLLVRGSGLSRLGDVGHEVRGFEGGFVDPERSYYVASRAFVVHRARVAGASAQVGSNTLTGTRQGHAIDAELAGTVVLGQNQCTQSPEAKQPAVRIAADAAAVTANRVVGGNPSMRLEVNPERLTVLGNLTSAGIDPPPQPAFAPLNLDGVL